MRALGLAVVGSTALLSCQATHRVAESSVNVATAPVRLVRHGFHRGQNSDAQEQIYEAVPVDQAPVAPTRTRERTDVATTSISRAPERTQAAPPTPTIAAAFPSPTPRPAAASANVEPEFPTAKPVPNKPGYVYSPFDGTMIDVAGFASGSKAKDPGNNKIFIVP